ncbi:MAG: DNA-binding transcriptional regulator [Melioribacter sp.]|nr:DNA-binding transcriptional regulator [Melioribacter sp.]
MKKIVLLLETSRAFGRQLIIGITRYAKLHGPWSFYKEPIDLKSSVPHLTNWNPDGIIMRDTLISKELLKLKRPTILAIHDSKYPQNLPVIKTDSVAIGKMAAEHFIEKGFKNFAYCGFDDYDWSEGRKIYYKKFLDEAGYKIHIYTSQSKKKLYWKNEQQNLINWIKSLPKPIGIFACNDDRGQHILEVCKIMGLKVPDDIAVIGVDNDPIVCELSDPPLTSIALDVEAAGFQAAKLIDYMIDKKKLTGGHILVSPTHIVQRQSTDIVAVEDHEVAKAIKYIKENVRSKLLVDDVVKATCLSRRTLERRFKQILRRTIYSQIQHTRIELISKFLIETDLPISQIASLFSFTDAEHISRYFKREKGMGLREFRKIHQPR